MRNKKILLDMFLNIFASSLPMIILQLIIFPTMASSLSGELYGILITIYSLFGIVPIGIGLTLNNIRLIHDEKYKEKNIQGDFKFLSLFSILLNILILLISFYILNIEINFVDTIVVLFVSIFLLLHEYLIVEYRIFLNYKKILFDRIFQSIGLVTGLFVYLYLMNYWIIPLLFGYLFSLVFVILNSNLWKEPFHKTQLFEFISKESLFLLIGMFLLKIPTYADKILVYPLLGSYAVSVYYAAMALSKMTSLLVTPINNVILSYLTKLNEKPSKLFWKIVVIGIFISILGYFLSIFVSEILLSLLYPMFYDEAVELLSITAGITVINILSSMIQPFILKFNSMKFQVIINSIDVFFYISISLLLLNTYGLIGFCYGVLISRFIRFILLIGIFHFRSNN